MKRSLLFLTAIISVFSVSLHAQDASLKDGQAALIAKDYARALSSFTTYTGSFSGQVSKYLKDQHSYDTSNLYYRTTLFPHFKINNDWAAGYYGLGVAQANLGQKDSAKKSFETSIAIDTKYGPSYFELGMIKKDNGDKIGSCIAIGMAIHFKDTAQAAKDAYAANACQTCGSDFFNRGKNNVDNQQYADAIGDLRLAATICPDSGDYIGYLGKAYVGLGKADSAIIIYTAAIRSNPSNYSAYFNRGVVYEQRQQYAEAFNDLTKALALNPSSVEAYIHRAGVCESMEKESSAIYDYKQIIRLNPKYGEAYYKIALYHLKLGQMSCDDFKTAAALGVEDARSYVKDCKDGNIQ